jgi:hypothetical protein
LRGETNALWTAIIHTGSRSAISASAQANSFKKTRLSAVLGLKPADSATDIPGAIDPFLAIRKGGTHSRNRLSQSDFGLVTIFLRFRSNFVHIFLTAAWLCPNNDGRTEWDPKPRKAVGL